MNDYNTRIAIASITLVILFKIFFTQAMLTIRYNKCLEDSHDARVCGWTIR